MGEVKVLHLAHPPPIQSDRPVNASSCGPICGMERLPLPGQSFQAIAPVLPRSSPSLSRSAITKPSGRRIIPQDNTTTFNKQSMAQTGGKLPAPGRNASKLFIGEPEYRAGKKCTIQTEGIGGTNIECNYPMPRLHRPTPDEYSGRAGTTTEYMNHNITGIKTFSPQHGDEIIIQAGKRHYDRPGTSTEATITSRKKAAPSLRSDPFGSLDFLTTASSLKHHPKPGPSAEMIFKPALNVHTDKLASDKSSILHTAPPTKFDITGPISIDTRKPTQSTAAMMAEYQASRQKAAEFKAREYSETRCY